MLTGAMKSSSKAKSMMNDKSKLENSGKGVFGKDFRDQITYTVKEQMQSKGFLFNFF